MTETRLPLPVYRDPRGRIRSIPGLAAETWPYPRVVEIDGIEFVEWPLPADTDWGLTFHGPWQPRTWIGYFVSQYVEGMASGFPWWPVVVFSARSTAARTWRKLTRKEAPRP